MAKKSKELSYDEAIQEVKMILHNLETGQTSIDELITSVEKGTALIKQCQAKLRDVEVRIQDYIKNEPKQ